MDKAFEQARHFFFEGLRHYEAGRFELAEKQFEASLALVPLRASTLTNLGATRMKLGKFADAAVVLEEATRLEPKDAQAWAHWATALAEQGEIARALERVDDALGLDPSMGAVWTLKGTMLREAGRAEEAAECFRCAIANGGDPQLNAFYLAALGTGEPPPTAPRAYVQSLFDSYAGEFDEHLLKVLRYRAPEILVQGLGARRFESVLDLGCGTGLVGQQLRGRAQRIVGVDLSGAMVERARRRGAYTELAQADLLEFLLGSRERFDLVIAADVFNYVGELRPVFEAVRKVLQPGGSFVFTVELAGTQQDGVVLRPSMRYGHSRGYIQALANESGFEITATAQHPIRDDQGTPIPGLFAWLAPR